MAMNKKQLIKWLNRIDATRVAVDDGGLALVGIKGRKVTEAYMEVGGIPDTVEDPDRDDD